jgi:radical SAM superfamily enzyme YgiQ (UPF0313 family)
MKITLIKPTIGYNTMKTYREKAVMEPLAFTLLASMTPDDIEVVLYDDRIEKIPYDEKTDLVVITVDTFTAKRTYEICAEYRKRGVHVLLGGHHPTLNPQETLNFADSIFTGDVEELWEEVISDLRTGNLKRHYNSSISTPQKVYKLRTDIYKEKKYLKLGLIQFGRGCQVGCSFCSVACFYKNTHFHRSIADVVEEIKFRKKKTWLFVDDNIIFNHAAAKELFKALIPLKINWVSQADISITRDPELMEIMIKSGCIGLLIGFESIDPKSIKNMNKSINLVGFDNYAEALKILRSNGLLIWGTFTFGHDNDTVESIKNTLDFAIENKLMMADFNVLVPFPNTPLYNELKNQNRLLYDGKWWLHPDYRFGKATFVPKNMTPDELESACFNAYRSFLSFNSILKRLFNRKTHMKNFKNMFLFALCNSLLHNETVKKKDIILGMGNN